MVTDRMDIPSAIAWRLTCRENYVHTTSSLKRSKLKLIGMFLCPSSAFVALLGQCNGVIGGDAALSYVLRTEAIELSVLDVYLPDNTYNAFVYHIARVEEFARCVTIAHSDRLEGDYSRYRQVTHRVEFFMTNGRKVTVWKSATCSPCMPIVTAVNTLHMNFVNDVAFGCAYPAFTLARRGLTNSLLEEEVKFPDEMQSMARLLAAGFSFACTPYHWSDYSVRRGWQPDEMEYYPCFAHLYACQDQARRFTDAGSALFFTDPLTTTLSSIRRRGQAPFGVMVMWWMVSRRLCNYETDHMHDDPGMMPTSLWVILYVEVRSRFYARGTATRPKKVTLETSSLPRRIRSMTI